MCCSHKQGSETEKTALESPCKTKCGDEPIGLSVDSSDSSDDSESEVELCKPAGKGKVTGADDSSVGRKKRTADDAQSDFGQQDLPSVLGQQVPRIYYATRTHSQIAQVLPAIRQTLLWSHRLLQVASFKFARRYSNCRCLYKLFVDPHWNGKEILWSLQMLIIA